MRYRHGQYWQRIMITLDRNIEAKGQTFRLPFFGKDH